MSLAALREFAELQQFRGHQHNRSGRKRRSLHVGSQCSQGKREGHEERSGSVRPLIDKIQWVPQYFSVVEDYPCAGDRDPDETEKRERDRDDCELNVLPSKVARVSPRHSR